MVNIAVANELHDFIKINDTHISIDEIKKTVKCPRFNSGLGVGGHCNCTLHFFVLTLA